MLTRELYRLMVRDRLQSTDSNNNEVEQFGDLAFPGYGYYQELERQEPSELETGSQNS